MDIEARMALDRLAIVMACRLVTETRPTGSDRVSSLHVSESAFRLFSVNKTEGMRPRK